MITATTSAKRTTGYMLQGLPATRSTTRLDTAVTIRHAKTEADALAIAEISRRGFSCSHRQAFTQSDLTNYLADSFNRHQIIGELMERNTIFLIAEIAGEIVGSLRLRRTEPTVVRLPKSVELSRFYLDPQQTGYGIGSVLMLRALHMAQVTGFKSCWLGVWQGNRRAIRFYQRWGFAPVGKDTMPVGQSCPIGLVMARQI